MGGDRHMTFVTPLARLAQRIPKMIKASSLLLVTYDTWSSSMGSHLLLNDMLT